MPPDPQLDRLRNSAEQLRGEYENQRRETSVLTNVQRQLASTLIRNRNTVLASISNMVQMNTAMAVSTALKKQEITLVRAELAAKQRELAITTATGRERTRLQNEINRLSGQLKTSAVEANALKFQKLANNVNILADEMQKMASTINRTQQQFGLDMGTAAELKIKDLMASAQSYIDSVTSGFRERAVGTKEIADARGAFQDVFGGALTPEAAEGIAKEALKMGVSAKQLADARRVFMTQTMGDVGKAKTAQDKFIGEFQKKGLTSKDAMQAIALNSELLARNGTRFATQFARAAADAKKIGVDLSKISQVGDNIINDFEGFLESQAELGAMGFGFDSNRLAQIAETGSDADLFNELRSQLAATGKDITKLRRSERLALEGAFGINISEMQRLAGGTPSGGGEETLTVEQLQAEANSLLTRIATSMDTLGPGLAAVSSAIGILGDLWMARMIKQIAKSQGGGIVPVSKGLRLRARGRMARGRIGRLGRGIAARAGSAGRAVSRMMPARVGLAMESLTFSLMNLPSKITGLLGRIPGVGALGRGVSSVGGRIASGFGKGSLLAGLFGGYEGFNTARESGKGRAEAAGAATIQGGFAAAGAALGTLIPIPVVGTIIGGWLGNVFGKGINKYFPSLAANLGLVFTGIGKAFEPVKKAFTGVWESASKMGEPLLKLLNVFSGTTDKANNLWPVLEKVGTIIGSTFAFALNSIASTLNIVIGAITATAQILTGDFSAAWKTLKDTFANSFSWLVDPIKNALVAVKDAITSTFTTIINWIIDKVNLLPGIEISNIPAKKGDDVVSLPGYGKRSLLTPNGVIALNNKDNIVAYADDLMGTTKLPFGSISKEFGNLDEFKTKVTQVFSGLGDTITGKFQNVRQSIGDVFGKSTGGLLGKFEQLKGMGTGFLGNIKSGGMGKVQGLMDKFAGEGSLFSKAKGLFGGGTDGLKQKAMDYASKIPGVGGLLSGGVGGLKEKALGFASKIPGVGGLLSGGSAGLKEKGLDFASKIPGLGSLLGGAKGTSGLTEKIFKIPGLSKVGTKIPGLSTILAGASGYKEGGIKGAVTSAAGAGAGSVIGGAIGTAIPIPVVGTMIGSVVGGVIGKGIGKTFGGLFGKKKPTVGKIASNIMDGGASKLAGGLTSKVFGKKVGGKVDSIASALTPMGQMKNLGKLGGKLSGLFGKKKTSTAQVSPEMISSATVPNLSMMLGSQTNQQPEITVPAATVDTSGIESKLHNFINALQNIQINMDGNQVGKVLVNVSEAAMTAAPFRAQSR